MEIPVVTVHADGRRTTHRPDHAEAHAFVTRALARIAAGGWHPPEPEKPVRYRDRSGRLRTITPYTVQNADGSREPWPPIEWRIP